MVDATLCLFECQNGKYFVSSQNGDFPKKTSTEIKYICKDGFVMLKDKNTVDDELLMIGEYVLPDIEWLQNNKPIMITKSVEFTEASIDCYVKRYMVKYGIDKVRGGSYLDTKLPNEVETMLTLELFPELETNVIPIEQLTPLEAAWREVEESYAMIQPLVSFLDDLEEMYYGTPPITKYQTYLLEQHLCNEIYPN